MKTPDGQPLSYRELATRLVPYVKNLGFTHIELMPIMEHPYAGSSWGYQVVGYFAPTARFGSPDDFRYFIDQCHQHGIGVIVDWVPAHFPRDAHGLARFDGSACYEHDDPRRGEHKDWGTLIFNFGRNEVRNFLISNALFWLEQYHIDGLRVDAVASMIYLDYSRNAENWLPNQYGGRENLEALEFLRIFNVEAHKVPGAITIAEESTSFVGVSHPVYAGGLGFTMKWNMGWMHDMFAYFKSDPLYRKFNHNHITFSLLYAFTENFLLPISHDEVVHGKSSLIGKMPGDEWQRFANVRAFLGFMYGHPGKKLLFMGCELGQYEEWNWQGQIRWDLLQYPHHRRLQDYVRELNLLYQNEPSLYQVDSRWNGFEWIDFHDLDASVISFVRRATNGDDFLVFVCNFTPAVRYHYNVGVPRPGTYQEAFNSDWEHFGGSGVRNPGSFHSQPGQLQGRSDFVTLTLPPLAVSVFPARGRLNSAWVTTCFSRSGCGVIRRSPWRSTSRSCWRNSRTPSSIRAPSRGSMPCRFRKRRSSKSSWKKAWTRSTSSRRRSISCKLTAPSSLKPAGISGSGTTNGNCARCGSGLRSVAPSSTARAANTSASTAARRRSSCPSRTATSCGPCSPTSAACCTWPRTLKTN